MAVWRSARCRCGNGTRCAHAGSCPTPRSAAGRALKCRGCCLEDARTFKMHAIDAVIDGASFATTSNSCAKPQCHGSMRITPSLHVSATPAIAPQSRVVAVLMSHES